MYGTFAGATNVTTSIELWDVSNVEYFPDMFSLVTGWNSPNGKINLSKWNWSKALDMSGMFLGTSSFNGIGSWDVRNVENMDNI